MRPPRSLPVARLVSHLGKIVSTSLLRDLFVTMPRATVPTARPESNRVLLIGPIPPPAGGIATHLAGLSRALERNGLEVTVLDPARGKLVLLRELLVARRHTAIHLHVCGHNWSSYALALACRACAGSAPVLVSIHSGIAPRYLGSVGLIARWLAQAALRGARTIVCVSSAIADAAKQIGVGKARIVVATPYIEERGELPPTPAAIDWAVGRRTPLVAAMVAAPDHEYGSDVLIAGFARFAAEHHASLLMVMGSDGVDRTVADRLASMGLGEKVIAFGEVNHQTAMGVLRACDLFVRPTRVDGDAVSVREALALGRRVVASDAATRPDGVVTFGNGDPDALARAMSAALQSAPPPWTSTTINGLDVLLNAYREAGCCLHEVMTCAESLDESTAPVE
ncbi:MAG: glycosyltransferase family 4 protein [Pseudomonadota bacterium]